MSDREDLLRIDGTGTIHPVGRIASQQMRAREGSWRVMPSAKNIVVLRREIEGGAVLKLAGEIRSPAAVCDVVSLIAQSNLHGELMVIDEHGTRSLFFDSGLMVGVQTNIESERLGETLYRFGVITRDQVDECIKKSNESGKRLGEAAVDLGFVSSEEIFPMMVRQAEEVFYAAMRITYGMFYFFDSFDDTVMLHRHSLNISGLMMEGARRMDELQFFREKIPNEKYLVTPLQKGKSPPDELLEVYTQCDGKRDIAEIGRRVGLLEFEVTQAVFQLLNAGYVTVAAPRPVGAVALLEAFNPALIEIHRFCDAADKGKALRDGLSKFATGGGVYDPLFMGAGPLPDGSFKPERVGKNLAALAGEEPDQWLLGLMHEYIGFALFHAGSLLGREQESQLVVKVSDLLKPVRPESKYSMPPPAAFSLD